MKETKTIIVNNPSPRLLKFIEDTNKWREEKIKEIKNNWSKYFDN